MMKLSVLAAMAVAMGLIPAAVSAAPLGQEWKRVDPRGGSAATDLTKAGDRLIAVGSGGAIWETTNRETWSAPDSTTDRNLASVVANNGVVVAVGAGGAIVRSGTAGVWTAGNSGTVQDLAAVAFGSGLFVAVGKGGTVIQSADGLDWSPWVSGVTTNLNGVTWSGTEFVACGDTATLIKATPGGSWGAMSILPAFERFQRVIKGADGWFIALPSSGYGKFSPDGVNWSNVSSGSVLDVVAAQGKFVGVSHSGFVRSSDDGVAWSQYLTPATAEFVAVEWTGSDYVAMTALRKLAVSTDGKRWTMKGTSRDSIGGCWDGSQYIAVGEGGSILTSPDGRTWTSEVNPGTSDLADVAFGNGCRVAVGDNTTILRSVDGRTWQKIALPTAWNFSDIHWTGSAFWVVGESGVILTSPDGLSWAVNTPGHLDAVIHDGSRYLAFSGRNILESTDGNQWRPLAHVEWHVNSTAPERKIKDLVWTGQYYVAVGEDGWILRSSDGVQWTRSEVASVAYNNLNAVAWSGSRFVVMIANTSNCLVSEDGLNWTQVHSSAIGSFYYKDVIWDGTRFVAVTGNSVATSPDGTTWTKIATITNGGPSMALRSLAWDGSRFIAVGSGGNLPNNGGLIGTSPDGITWTLLPIVTGKSFVHVTCDATSAVAIREDGSVRRWNGTSWLAENSGMTGEPVGLLKSGSSYHGFSSTGMISTSSTSGSWQTGDRRADERYLLSITSGNGVLVAGGLGWGGSGASILTSTDGRNWTQQVFPGYQGPFFDCIWTGSRFLVVGGNEVFASATGINWETSASSWSSGEARSLAWFGGKAIVGGNSHMWLGDEGGYRVVKDSAGSVQAFMSNGSELLAIGTGDTMGSSDGEHWTAIDPDQPLLQELTDVVYSPAGFFACGDAGKLLHSPDGAVWTERVVDELPKLNALIRTDIGLVGVGRGLTFSPDGQSWISKPNSGDYLSVASGNGIIVAISATTSEVSTNGTTWQRAEHNMGAKSVTWNGTEFVMALEDRGVAISSDGLSWKVIVIPRDLAASCATEDSFLVANSLGDVYRSTDGIGWTRVLDHAVRGKMRLVRTGSLFFAFGSDMYRSADGITWTMRMRTHNDIVWTGERYVGVGDYGVISTSPDGAIWSDLNSGISQHLNRVVWTGSGLIAVGANGTFLTSPNGLTWTPSSSGTTKTLVDLAMHGGKWIAVASDGILVSEAAVPTVPDGFLANAFFVEGNTLLVAGRKGRIASLTDGVWSEATTATYWDLQSICNTPAGLQASGIWNVILRRQPDGSWAAVSGGVSGLPQAIASERFTNTVMTGGKLVALGDRGLIVSSAAAGRIWTPQARPGSQALRDAVEVDGQLFAVGDNGSIARMAGSTGTLEQSFTSLGLRAVAEGKGRLVAVGEDGVILLSKPDEAPEIEVYKSGGDPLVSGASSVAFGYGTTGNVSAVSFTVTNTGMEELSGLSVALGGEHAADFKVSPALGSTVLAPSESATFTVRFAPDVVGTRNASLSIHSNDSDESPFTISLTGDASAMAPELVVEILGEGTVDSGEVMSFGTVTSPKKVTRTLVIRNVGKGSLSGLTMLKSGESAVDFKTPKLKPVLKPGKSIKLKVTLSSKVAGAKSALVRISSNDPVSSTFDVNLTGIVQPPVRAPRRSVPEKLAKAGGGDSDSDADHDGLSDFMEWALGSDPSVATVSPTTLSIEGDPMIFSYTRSNEAILAGVNFEVEWSDDLLVWQVDGVRELASTAANPAAQQVQAEVPKGTKGHRYVRLRVSEPR